MANARVPDHVQVVLDKVVAAGGDLRDLGPDERVIYYHKVCDDVGVTASTLPFAFLVNEKSGAVTLYALKSCTDQLRKSQQINAEIVAQEVIEGCYVVHVRVSNPEGRKDEDLGAVGLTGKEEWAYDQAAKARRPTGRVLPLQGEERANAMLKAITKAKRRATLSICGLSMLDETEVETIPTFKPMPEESERVATEAGGGELKADNPWNGNQSVPPQRDTTGEDKDSRRRLVVSMTERASRVGMGPENGIVFSEWLKEKGLPGHVRDMSIEQIGKAILGLDELIDQVKREQQERDKMKEEAIPEAEPDVPQDEGQEEAGTATEEGPVDDPFQENDEAEQWGNVEIMKSSMDIRAKLAKQGMGHPAKQKKWLVATFGVEKIEQLTRDQHRTAHDLLGGLVLSD